LVRTDPIQRSAIAFVFGALTGVRIYFYPKGSNSSVKDGAIAAVPVMNEIARWPPLITTSLHHLLGEPLGSRMCGCSGMHNLSAAMINHEEDIQSSKPDRSDREQITCPNLFGMLRKKPTPPGRRDTVVGSAHILGDSPGTHLEAKPGEFRLDSLLPPERILTGHTADQGPEI